LHPPTIVAWSELYPDFGLADLSFSGASGMSRTRNASASATAFAKQQQQARWC